MIYYGLEEKQDRKLGPMGWGCNCHEPLNSNGEQKFTRMYPTQVDADGICISCSHYAFRIEKSTLEAVRQRPRIGKYKKKLK